MFASIIENNTIREINPKVIFAVLIAAFLFSFIIIPLSVNACITLKNINIRIDSDLLKDLIVYAFVGIFIVGKIIECSIPKACQYQ